MRIGWAKGIVVVSGALLLSGCGAKHTVGDYVIYDPDSPQEDGGGTGGGEQPQPAAKDTAEHSQKAQGSAHADSEDAAWYAFWADDDEQPAHRRAAADNEDVSAAKPDPSVNRYMEADGTSYGGEDWAAEVHEEGDRFWLETPFDPQATYATVRAASRMQGLPIAQEEAGKHHFRTKKAYRGWQGGSETGMGLFMKVLTKGFGKDARYAFDVRVLPMEDGDGSRVQVRQHREVQRGDRTQDVGDWVKADSPDPEISRDYIQALQRAFGEKRSG